MKMVTIGGKRLALVAASFIAGSAVPTALVIADSGPPKAVFDEISVKRINIVEPGGKYRLVLANSERFPGLFMEGKEYKHHSRDGRSEEHTSALQSLLRHSYAVFCLHNKNHRHH